jgi:type II secretion system protein N
VDRRRSILYYVGGAIWGAAVLVLVIYLFFPYQRASRVALQNIVGGGRAAVAMEGVRTAFFGIRASRLLIQPDPTNGQKPFELSNIDIAVNPLSLLGGKLRVRSTASLYDGVLHTTIDGIRLMGSSSPAITLTLRNINMARVPGGTIPWLRSISGVLHGNVEKRPSSTSTDKQVGSFKLLLTDGEINDLQIKGMPRLVIPYKEISVEGRIDGSRIDLTKLAFTSNEVTLGGSGTLDSTDPEQTIDMRLSYQGSSKTFPLGGRGTMRISGNQSAPVVVLTEAEKTLIAPSAGSVSR